MSGSHGESLPREYMEMVAAYDRQTGRKLPDRDLKSIRGRSGNSSRAQTPLTKSEAATPEVIDIYSTSDSDDWEDVNLQSSNLDFMDEDDDDEFEDVLGPIEPGTSNEPLVVNLQPQAPAKPSRAPPMPRAERIALHLFGILGWIVHVRTRNSWLASRRLVGRWKGFLPTNVLQELHPPDRLSPTLKSKKLMDGLRHAMNCYRREFAVSRPGLYCVGWEEFKDKDREIDRKTTRKQFVSELLEYKGSADMLGQSFCGLLRAVGLECRLVSSLQPPDWTSPGSSGKPRPPRVARDTPLFWTEVWDRYANRWIAVDPVQNVMDMGYGKSPLEPRVTDPRNIMRYVLSWNADGTGHDVTVRYSSQYLSRVRKKRIAFAGYEDWYNRVMAAIAPKTFTARDGNDVKLLQRRLRSEGIPSRLADFVGHPLYVLEHQLKKTELLEPKEASGRLATKNQGVFRIYPRSSVKQTHSAQSWYRRGRVLKEGVQPKLFRESDNRLTGEREKVGLYTMDQTTLFVPEPVAADGTIPRVHRTTIDLFTSNMLPGGAVYIPGKGADAAARLLGVDFAKAVVGVKFSRKGAESVENGIVVAQQFEPAVREVLAALMDQAQQEVEAREEFRLLSLWRKLIITAQVWQRVNSMNPGDIDEADADERLSSDFGSSSEYEPSDSEIAPSSLAPDAPAASVATSPRPKELQPQKPHKQSPKQPKQPKQSTYIEVPTSELLEGAVQPRFFMPETESKPKAGTDESEPIPETQKKDNVEEKTKEEGDESDSFPDVFMDEMSESELM